VAKNPADDLLNVLSAVMIGLVAGDTPDLTMRGLSILTVTRTLPGPHTVRGLAEQLGTSKPAITRTVDRLAELGLVQRAVDPADRRSVLFGRNPRRRGLCHQDRAAGGEREGLRFTSGPLRTDWKGVRALRIAQSC
jgi:DNA-binding MarR family transcriptional regulator